jgi:hypothetical protein
MGMGAQRRGQRAGIGDGDGDRDPLWIDGDSGVCGDCLSAGCGIRENVETGKPSVKPTTETRRHGEKPNPLGRE